MSVNLPAVYWPLLWQEGMMAASLRADEVCLRVVVTIAIACVVANGGLSALSI
jgi:hypothetical protein